MELTDNHKALIKNLASGHFFSTQQLASELGVSRTSAWNYLKALESMGFELHAVSGKGTRLKQMIELLESEVIISLLSSEVQCLLAKLDLLDVCPSTNHHLLQQNSLKPLANGVVCMAEMQTMGRGRLGKTWVSPYGQNIYLSFIWNFKSGIAALSGLSLACGVAVCCALDELGVKGHGLKWPNDILWQGKKLGGILVEIQGESQGGYSVVVGIGINYQMSSQASTDIDQPWVDVCTAAGDSIGRNKLAAKLIERVLGMLDGYEEKGLTPYVEQWNAFDCYKGSNVNIIAGKKVTTGVAKGISSGGELILQKQDGTQQLIMSGEVSLRLGEP